MNSVDATLAERGKRYGDFTDHAHICQSIKMAMFATAGTRWAQLPDTHKQALEVIADKIARILSGDPNYEDNWHDIQGYAKLVEDRIKMKKPVAGVGVAIGGGFVRGATEQQAKAAGQVSVGFNEKLQSADPQRSWVG